MMRLDLAHKRRTKPGLGGWMGLSALLLGGVVAGGTSNADPAAGQPAPRHPMPNRAIWKQIAFPSDVQTSEEGCKDDPTRPPGSAKALLAECVCEDATTKSGDALSPKQTARCVEAESERIAQRDCGFIESEGDFYACACPLFRVYRPNTTATPLGPEEMTRCLQRAPQKPPPAPGPKPASGQANVLEARIDLPCSLFAGSFDRHPKFDATLEWSDDGVRVGSDTFSCSLVGPPSQLVAAANCSFMVGGGSARTAVVCPAARINGQRIGDGLHLTAFNCSGRLRICNVSADVDVSVAPKGP